jgi:hypothetical protein
MNFAQRLNRAVDRHPKLVRAYLNEHYCDKHLVPGYEDDYDREFYLLEDDSVFVKVNYGSFFYTETKAEMIREVDRVINWKRDDYEWDYWRNANGS